MSPPTFEKFWRHSFRIQSILVVDSIKHWLRRRLIAKEVDDSVKNMLILTNLQRLKVLSGKLAATEEDKSYVIDVVSVFL